MTVPPYAAYRESGVEWPSKIPTGWVMHPLKRVASITYGLGQPPEYVETGVRFLRATNVKRGALSTEGLVHVKNPAPDATRVARLKAGDIIVVRSGAYTGDSALITPDWEGSIAGFDMIVKVKQEITPQFLAVVLLSNYVLEAQIGVLSMRAAQPHLNAQELSEVMLALPPPDQQSAITAFLDRETGKIDALVWEQERLIALLKEKRQAVISQAVTKGLDPTVPMKHSGVEWLGEVPAHWTVLPLSRITRSMCDGPFGSGLKSEHYVSEGARVIRLQNIRKIGFDGADAAFVDEGYFKSQLSGHDVRENDILIAGLGDERNTVGRACVAPDNLGPALVKADCFRFRTQADRVLPEFLAFQLTSGAEFDAGQLSSGSTRSRIPLSVMATRRVALPSLSEQKAIYQDLTTRMAALASLDEQATRAIALLRERRAALIAAAVTGKIDVREQAAVPSAQAA